MHGREMLRPPATFGHWDSVASRPPGESALMSTQAEVSRHYTHGELLDTVFAGLDVVADGRGSVTVEDLATFDEFHIGGRRASEAFFNGLDFPADGHLLDVGCGLGGAARFAADRFGCRVSGIDVTLEYVRVGNALSVLVDLDRRVELSHGCGSLMPFADDSFDGGFMMHVGMNIRDKPALFAEVHRVIRPGALLGVYDVVRTGPGKLDYPVPWAGTPETCFLSTPAEYVEAFHLAGFKILARRDRRDFALEYFARATPRIGRGDHRSSLGLHTLMGDRAATKLVNMSKQVAGGRIAPMEFVVCSRERPTTSDGVRAHRRPAGA